MKLGLPATPPTWVDRPAVTPGRRLPAAGRRRGVPSRGDGYGGFATLLPAARLASRMFGGGGMNPRKMQQMMEQMGIEMTELDADEVVIRTGDEELVFSDVQVTRMDAQGTQTYQIVGEPETREAADAPAVEAGEAHEAGEADESVDDAAEIPDSDVQIVAQRAGVSPEAAREALVEADGDLAAAINALE